MSDTSTNKFCGYGTNAERLAFTPTPATIAAAPNQCYYWYETDTDEVFFYTTSWQGPFVASSGGGTVTHTGALTANQLVGGNGVADIKVVDLTGDITTSGGLATTLKTAAKTRTIPFIIDGAGVAITTGIKGDVYIPYACTITAVTMLADQSGSIVVDIWRDSYANYPPDVADTITSAAKPTITTALKSQDNTLTGWLASCAAGDTLRYNVDSASTVTRVVVTLTVTI